MRRMPSRKATCSSVKFTALSPGRPATVVCGCWHHRLMVLPFHYGSQTMKTSSPVSLPAGAERVAAAARAVPTFAPIHTRRAFEEICERIRAQIGAGTLRPGDKLPAERELALQLGVGRNALREALRSLEIAGIVRLQKGVKGGAFIQAGDAGRMDDVVRDMLSLGSISVAELTESRVHIQDLVVRLACARATRADLDALAANIDRTEAMTTAG